MEGSAELDGSERNRKEQRFRLAIDGNRHVLRSRPGDVEGLRPFRVGEPNDALIFGTGAGEVGRQQAVEMKLLVESPPGEAVLHIPVAVDGDVDAEPVCGGRVDETEANPETPILHRIGQLLGVGKRGKAPVADFFPCQGLPVETRPSGRLGQAGPRHPGAGRRRLSRGRLGLDRRARHRRSRVGPRAAGEASDRPTGGGLGERAAKWCGRRLRAVSGDRRGRAVQLRAGIVSNSVERGLISRRRVEPEHC